MSEIFFDTFSYSIFLFPLAERVVIEFPLKLMYLRVRYILGYLLLH